jgi:hypothetical protein
MQGRRRKVTKQSDEEAGELLLPLVTKIPSESSAANALKWVASVSAVRRAFLAALVNSFRPKRSGHVLTRESGYCNRRPGEVVFLVSYAGKRATLQE